MVASHLSLVNIHEPDTVQCSVEFTWLILVLWLNRVPRKEDFKLGKYTSNGARSVEYGWWIARLNPNTSNSWNVFLIVWHRMLSWCNTRRQYRWSVRRIFVWRRHFLLDTSLDGVLHQCVSCFKNIAKCLLINMMAWKWHRIRMLWLFTWKMDACICSKHLNKLTWICACQIFGRRRPGVLVYIK